MTRKDVEHLLSRMSWPEPSAALRTRVLLDVPMDERSISGAARVAGDSDLARHAPIPVPESAGRRRHGWRRASVLVALSILVMVGSCTGLDVWANRQVEAEIARIEAQYGSLEVHTLRLPDVPATDNRARMVRAAVALAIARPNTPMRAYWSVPVPLPSPIPDDLRAFADSNHAAIRLAGGIRTRRQSSWEFDGQASGFDFSVFLSSQILSDAVYVAAMLELEAGRADNASDLIVSGLGIAASMRQEPEMFIQKVRMNNVMFRQFDAIRRLLTTAAPSQTALTELAWWLDENRVPGAMQASLLGYTKSANAMFARMENGDIDRNTASWIYPMTWPEWPSAFLGVAARIGQPFVRTARLRYLQRMKQLLDAESGPRPRPRLPEPPPPQRWALVDRLTDKFAAEAWDYSDVGDEFMSELGATEIAVALRRFKLDHNTYPDDLSSLVPAYLARLPIDPYTGRPPIYRRQGEGFTLRATGSGPEMVKWRVLEWSVPK